MLPGSTELRGHSQRKHHGLLSGQHPLAGGGVAGEVVGAAGKAVRAAGEAVRVAERWLEWLERRWEQLGRRSEWLGTWSEQLVKQRRGRRSARPPILPLLTAATSPILAVKPPPRRAVPVPWCPSTAGMRRLCPPHPIPALTAAGPLAGGWRRGKGLQEWPMGQRLGRQLRMRRRSLGWQEQGLTIPK